MARTRILLVDDQAMFREGLRTLLATQPDFEVVGEAGNGEEALQLYRDCHPDVVLMDLRMPRLDGVAATRRLRADHTDARIIVLTTFDDDEDIFEGLRAGAVGYLLKDASSAKLFEAVRAAARGESFLQPSIAARVVAEFARLADAAPHGEAPVVDLSERELEVLRCVAQGASNKEIAAKLYIAEGTVKNHLTSAYNKLEVRDRTQAVLKARALGLL